MDYMIIYLGIPAILPVQNLDVEESLCFNDKCLLKILSQSKDRVQIHE